MASYLKFHVKENDSFFSLSEMSEPETAAIAECVEEILPQNRLASEFWLEADVCLQDEEFCENDELPSFGLLRCYTHNPTPKNTSLGECRIPHPLPREILTELSGKTFRVTPRQLGLSPWGAKVEVVFESQPSVISKSEGIKASTLIAAALKHQKSSLS